MRRIVIAGISTRAAAESAARAGFDVTAIDAFADLDQYPSVRALSIPRPFTARAAARVARDIECSAVTYLSNFENHPDDVSELAAGRELWGNPPAVLRRVRDPESLERALRRRGMAVPRVRLPPPRIARRRGAPERSEGVKPDTTAPGTDSDGERDWLVKPLASGGGHAVQKWVRGTPVPDDCYLQELVAGSPGSVVFVAARGRTRPLGVTRQLVGDRSFGATGYRYCGSVMAPAWGDDVLGHAACALASAVAEEFDLVGVNGIDFIARDTRPFAIEVNPRWTASTELAERACGLNVFAAHADACSLGALPDLDFAAARSPAQALGKAIVFAREDVTIGDPSKWLGDSSVRDVPHAGERIRSGRPVCTVFAAGRDDAACYAALVCRAERVYADLDAWSFKI
jgi:predicted ATP-grasp superfamily ATP-dependent carboligase